MSDITELERRITAALDRIGAGIDGLQAPEPAGPDPEMVAQLEAAEANATAAQARIAELEATLKEQAEAKDELEAYLTQKSEEAVAAAQSATAEAYEQRKATAKLDTDLQRLRVAAEGLRASNIGLRAALEGGVGDAALINSAMSAELETLRAARSVEIAQADALLASLEPLVKRAGEGENSNA
ncbi:hypothetical protein [Planktotalea sp.]|uniref:hypothetical protein n=1 Tax=Planktotalea sp. TaxID=2029877 RepID=UPI00329A7C6C